MNYLVFEYVSKFYLYDYLMFGRLTERQAKLLFKKILNGVQAIHNANICHRDITPENIIFEENNNKHYNPKISDFSLSCINTNNLQEYIGNIHYLAPEIIAEQPYNGFQTDTFSLGQILFLLVTGKFGFYSSKANDPHYSLIRNHQFDIYWQREEFHNLNLSNEFKDLFVRMVAFNPNERPTIDGILNAPWMQEINNLNDAQLDALENEVRNALQNREAQIINQHNQVVQNGDNGNNNR